MVGLRKLLEHLADDTAEALENINERLEKLEKRDYENTTMLLILYEALLAATSVPGSPFTAAQKAREILALAGE